MRLEAEERKTIAIGIKQGTCFFSGLTASADVGTRSGMLLQEDGRRPSDDELRSRYASVGFSGWWNCCCCCC